MKILWLKNNLLHPLDSGGRIRTYNMLRAIRRHHEVHYMTFADPEKDGEAMSRAGEYCHELFHVGPLKLADKQSISYYARVLLTMFDPDPLTVTSYRSERMKRLVSDLAESGGYDIVVADFLAICLNVPENLEIPRVHFSHNVEAMIWKRHVENERNPIRKLVFKRELSRVEAFERSVIRNFSLTLAVSKKDFEYFSREYGGTNLGYVTTGVDTEFYRPSEAPVDPGNILFLGSMDWMPNIDAVTHFVQNIYPLIKERHGKARLSIVGRNPVDSVLRLASDEQGITVTGSVPDTRPFVASAACAVVPIRIGGGTRLKIYELMSMGKAVVSTRIGAEGLDYDEGENILIEDDPRRFAEAVTRVLDEESYRRKVGARARSFVVANCSWDAVSERFMDMLSNVRER